VQGQLQVVRGNASGRLYAVAIDRIYLLDGLGRPIESTCFAGHIPKRDVHPIDRAWSCAIALQTQELEVRKWPTWRREFAEREKDREGQNVQSRALGDQPLVQLRPKTNAIRGWKSAWKPNREKKIRSLVPSRVVKLQPGQKYQSGGNYQLFSTTGAGSTINNMQLIINGQTITTAGALIGAQFYMNDDGTTLGQAYRREHNIIRNYEQYVGGV
jgi:hypothetical protein